MCNFTMKEGGDFIVKSKHITFLYSAVKYYIEEIIATM